MQREGNEGNMYHLTWEVYDETLCVRYDVLQTYKNSYKHRSKYWMANGHQVALEPGFSYTHILEFNRPLLANQRHYTYG